MGKIPELIKVDMGPYASRIYKFTLFDDEEYYMADSNQVLKFLHFNIAAQGHEPKKMSKRMFHTWQSRTVAALALSPHAIKGIASDFVNLAPDTQLFIEMTVGVAFVSRDDNYNRKVGRDESVKAMTDLQLEVKSVNLSPSHIYVNLAPHKGVALTLRLNRKSGFSSVLGQITGRAEDRT